MFGVDLGDQLVESKERAEYWEDQARFLEAELAKYRKVIRYGPRGCICHVRQADGYDGVSHTTDCKAFTNALKKVDCVTAVTLRGDDED